MKNPIGTRFIHKGKIGKCIAYTDSGNLKLAMPSGEEVWTTHGEVCPIDGQTKGFRVFELPQAA